MYFVLILLNLDLTMITIFKNLANGALVLAGAAIAFTGAIPAQAAIIDLGFSLDRSGSVGASNWSLITTGLSSALSSIPLTGPDQYRVSVSSFSTSATLDVAPIILTSANIASVQAAILGIAYTGGFTCIDCSVTQLTTAVSGVGFGDLSFLNLSTDGVPNVGNTNGNTIRTAAVAAGWDSLSAEAIGSFDLTFLGNFVSPQPAFITDDPTLLPNPLTQGFILEVANFTDYASAIEAKVQLIVDPPKVPEPSAVLGLLGVAGLGALARRRRS